MASPPGTPITPENRFTNPSNKKSTAKKRAFRDVEDTKETPITTKRYNLGRKECILCCNDVVKNQFPKLPHAAGLSGEEPHHSSDICFKCYSQHLEGEVKNKGFENVRCPQCAKTLVEGEVRKLASSFTYRE